MSLQGFLPTISNGNQLPFNTNPVANAIVVRDDAGGAEVKAMYCTSLVTSGSIIGTAITYTTDFTAGVVPATDYFVSTSGGTPGNRTVTMPNAATNEGLILHFWHVDMDGRNVTLSGVIGKNYLAANEYGLIIDHARVVAHNGNWYGTD